MTNALATINPHALNDSGLIDFSVSPSSKTVTKEYACSADYAETAVANIPSTCPTDSTCTVLQGIRVRTDGSKKLVKIEATWARPTNSSTGYKPNGTIERSVSADAQMFPVDCEALLTSNGGPYTASRIAAAKREGFRALPVSSVRYNYSEYIDHFDWTEANIVALCGKTSTPPGITSATAGKWLLDTVAIDVTGIDPATNTENVKRTRQYVYSASGWNGA